MASPRTRLYTTVEFTYEWYQAFLDRLQDAGFDFRTFTDGVTRGSLLLRHDVDLSLEKALAMARMEAERGISATYCILLTSPLYNPLERTSRDQIHAIEALGHEVALHFSTHEYWQNGDKPAEEELGNRIRTEQEILRTVTADSTETVSAHIPPAWILDRSFTNFRNTYAPEYFSEIDYVADSGQRWRTAPPDIPDPPASVQILTHPGLWGDADGQFEERVEWATTDACREAERKAQLEFLQGTPGT